jgi:DNA transformation protein
MPASEQFCRFVLEQLGALARVEARRMFGGRGLYCAGVFFGLIARNDTLYFRTGESNVADYDARGMPAFRPFPDRPHVGGRYREVPPEVLEDAELLLEWARRAMAAGSPIKARAPGAPRRRSASKSRRRTPGID